MGMSMMWATSAHVVRPSTTAVKLVDHAVKGTVRRTSPAPTTASRRLATRPAKSTILQSPMMFPTLGTVFARPQRVSSAPTCLRTSGTRAAHPPMGMLMIT